jgi:hypothetical protein
MVGRKRMSGRLTTGTSPDESVQGRPLSLTRFAPVTMKVMFTLVFTPLLVSIAFCLLYVVAPMQVASFAEAVSGISRRVVSFLAMPSIALSDGTAGSRYSISLTQRMANDAVIAFDVLSLIGSLVLHVTVIVCYRAHIAAWLRYRFGPTVKEYLRSLGSITKLMGIIAIVAAIDLKWGGATLSIVQLRFSGEIASFPLVLFRSGAWFFLLNMMAFVGTQASLFSLLGFERRETS